MPTLTFTDTSKAITLEELRAVEAKIGAKLPKALREHYLKWNGGQTEQSWFVGLDDVEYDIHEFSPMKHRSYDGEVLFEDQYAEAVKRKIVPPKFVPFAIDKDANFFCVEVESGQIFLMKGEPPAGKRRGILLAHSFEDMAKGLITEDEMWEYIPDDELDERAETSTAVIPPRPKAPPPKKPAPKAKKAAAKKAAPKAKKAAAKKAAPKAKKVAAKKPAAKAKKVAPKKPSAKAKKAVPKKAAPKAKKKSARR